MKKSLFGVAAAGLALALAITSFGCESGHDNPLRVPTDVDWAKFNKTSFSFVSVPNDYTNSPVGSTITATEYGKGKVGSWVWEGYEAGTNKWNRDVPAKSEGANYTITRGDVTGDKVGDVVKTKKTTVTLNAGDCSWSMTSEATNKEVFQIFNWDYKSTGTGASATITGAVDEFNYASRKQVPWKVMPKDSSSALPANYASYQFKVVKGNDVTATTVTPGILIYYPPNQTEADVIETSINRLKEAIDAQEKYVAQLKRNEAGNATAIANAENDLKKFKDWHTNAWTQREGAAFVVLEETTKDGVTKSVTSWKKAIDKDVVASQESTSGTESKTEGKYTVISGDYISGTFLVTKYNTITFNDKNDKNEGTYIDEGAITRYGDIAKDYPASTETIKGNKLQYNGRVFVIENKVLRGKEPVIDTKTFTSTSSQMTRDNIFGWTYQSYEAKHKDQYGSWSERTAYYDERKALVTYQGQ